VIHVRRAYVWGRFKEPKSKASKAPVPMHPLLAGFLLAWREKTQYAKDCDFRVSKRKAQGQEAGLRQRSEWNLPCLAGSSHDSALGDSRSGCGTRNAGRNRGSIPRCLLLTGSANQRVPLPSPLLNRQTCSKEGTRPNRTRMRFSSYARITAELVGTAFLLMAVVVGRT
jgi:hypothetical protein